MKLKAFGMVAAASLAFVALNASAEGKFCVVTQHGQQCYYYDANQCRQAAYRQGGMCVLNQQNPAPRSRLNITEMMDSVRKAGDEGRERGTKQYISRLASQAYGAAPDVQRKLVQQAIAADAEQGFALARALGIDHESSVQQPEQQPGMPRYRCSLEGGGVHYTSTPVAGCVYLGAGN